MTKTMTGTKSSAAGTDLADAIDSKFMIVWEQRTTQATFNAKKFERFRFKT
jgi:hypothetical protein